MIQSLQRRKGDKEDNRDRPDRDVDEKKGRDDRERFEIVAMDFDRI